MITIDWFGMAIVAVLVLVGLPKYIDGKPNTSLFQDLMLFVTAYVQSIYARVTAPKAVAKPQTEEVSK